LTGMQWPNTLPIHLVKVVQGRRSRPALSCRHVALATQGVSMPPSQIQMLSRQHLQSMGSQVGCCASSVCPLFMQSTKQSTTFATVCISCIKDTTTPFVPDHVAQVLSSQILSEVLF